MAKAGASASVSAPEAGRDRGGREPKSGVKSSGWRTDRTEIRRKPPTGDGGLARSKGTKAIVTIVIDRHGTRRGIRGW